MKKIYSFSLALLSLAIPLAALAINWQQGDSYPADKTFEENVYIAAEKTVIESTFKGDLVVFGGDVRILGPVEGDLTVAGGTVWIAGPVKGDLRLASGEVTLNSEVSGEAVIAAGRLELGSKAKIGKDLTAGVGEVRRDALAVIGGKYEVWDESSEDKKVVEKPAPEEFNALIWFYALLFNLSALLLSGFAYYGLFGRAHIALEDQLFKGKNTAPAIGIGLAAIFLTPLASLFILLSGVGYLISFILLIGYFLLLLIAMIIAGPLFGSWLRIKFFTKAEKTSSMHISLGIISLHLLCIIPFAGIAIGLLAIAITTGQVAISLWKASR